MARKPASTTTAPKKAAPKKCPKAATPETIALPHMLTLDDVATLMRTAKSTILNRVAMGDFPAPASGKGHQSMWRSDVVKQWLDDCQEAANREQQRSLLEAKRQRDEKRELDAARKRLSRERMKGD